MNKESSFLRISHEEGRANEPKIGVKNYNESGVKSLWELTRGKLRLHDLEEFKPEERQKVVEAILNLTFDEFDQKLSSIIGKINRPTEDTKSQMEAARHFPSTPQFDWLKNIQKCEGINFASIYTLLKSRVYELDKKEEKYIDTLSKGLTNADILENIQTPFRNLVFITTQLYDKFNTPPEDCYKTALYAFNQHFVGTIFRASGLFKKMTITDKSRFVKQILKPIQEGQYKNQNEVTKIVGQLLFHGTTRGEDYEIYPEIQAEADQNLADFQDYLGELMIGTLHDKSGRKAFISFAKRLPKRFEQILGMVKNEEERKKIREMLKEAS